MAVAVLLSGTRYARNITIRYCPGDCSLRSGYKPKADGKKLVEDYYKKKTGQDKYMDVKMYDDFHDMLNNKDIDAVVISTPDHWHTQPAIEAALAGKHVYLQKPTSLTVTEGRYS